MCKRVVASAALAAGFLAFTGIAQAAALKVMADSPLGPALSKVLEGQGHLRRERCRLSLVRFWRVSAIRRQVGKDRVAPTASSNRYR